MDGSAIGILGKSPNFEQNTSQLRAVSNVPDRQYITRMPKSHQFVDLIMISAQQTSVKENFDIRLEKK